MPVGIIFINTCHDRISVLPYQELQSQIKTLSTSSSRLQTGESTPDDAKNITSLHLAYYKHDTAFMTNLKQDQKAMWIYAKNTDKDKTNMDMLIHTSDVE